MVLKLTEGSLLAGGGVEGVLDFSGYPKIVTMEEHRGAREQGSKGGA